MNYTNEAVSPGTCDTPENVTRIAHRYDIGDQSIFVVRASNGVDTRRAALYCQFMCEEWFGDEQMLSNLGVAALLVMFYGHQHCARCDGAQQLDLHDDREAMICGKSGSDVRALLSDSSLQRDGLRSAMAPFVVG